MKVLHCISTANIGGIERLVIELAIAQKNQGIDVAIILDRIEGLYFPLMIKNQIPIFDSKINHGFDFNFRKLKQLKKIFNNYEIVHLHNFAFLRSLAGMQCNAQIVYTIHGLSKGIRKENSIKYFFRESMKKYFLNKVDFFIANSNYTLSEARKQYNLNCPNKTILNGIKIIKPDYSLYVNTSNEFTIGLVSRFTPRKRIDRLIDGFIKFLKIGGKGNLVLVGDGTEFNSIRELIILNNLQDYVTMTGYQTNVGSFYQNFDLCVHPSDNEGFGLVGVEAYLHGKPIIAFSDSGGLIEVIKPIEPENIVNSTEDLANRLLFYYNNRALINLESNSRIEYAIKNFAIERMERDYFEVYQYILK